jgi:GNAT superfamily N-acetyltransferase
MENHPSLSFRSATPADAGALSDLARHIWYAAYPGMITEEQIEYMLAWMYAIPTLEAEMRDQGIRFILATGADGLAGFSSYGPSDRPGWAKIHKLYLEPGLQGKGLGSRLLQETEARARSEGFQHVWLQVNKYNHKGNSTYQRNGYTKAGEVVDDIGGGFVMDDFVYEKTL